MNVARGCRFVTGAESGVDGFRRYDYWRAGRAKAVEVGPGAVLSGLVRQIDASIACVKFGEAGDWEKLGV
jgi:hypothetical protein